jgi:diacylglycerol kinase family enzyme
MNPATRRLCAIAALLTAAGAVVLAVVVLWNSWAELAFAVVAATIASAATWYVLAHDGVVRVVAAVVVVGSVAAAVVVLAGDQNLLLIAAILVLALATAELARLALRSDARTLREEAPPGVRMPPARHPVLVCNPRSGGGKASPAFVAEARRRGIETVMLEPGTDLDVLARDAIARGADVIGMAGGDGSQALVAGIAAEHDVPFVCIPAGTRNHFALDLGVDRDDLVGALDAFTDGYERRVDLARVNGRVFVNNVSFGVYAEIVQSPEYRDDKLGTTAALLPQLLGPDYSPFDLEIDGPDDAGVARPDLLLVSNNVYRLSGIGGLGTRMRLDEGVLGVVVVDVRTAADLARLVALEAAGAGAKFSGWREWSTETIEIRSSGRVNAGIDGEAVVLDAPVQLVSEPGALRIRIAPQHPGMSPAAVVGRTRQNAVRRLLRIAAGRESDPAAAGSAG